MRGARRQVGPRGGRREKDTAEIVVHYRKGPARLERADPRHLPALDKAIAFEGKLPRPTHYQPVLAMKIGQPAVQFGPRLIVLYLEYAFVGEGVYGSRKCVVDVEHEPSAEPLLQAGLKRMVDRIGVGIDGVRALVFVKTEHWPAQLRRNHAFIGVVEEVASRRRRLDVDERVVDDPIKVAREASARNTCAAQKADAVYVERLMLGGELQQLRSLRTDVSDFDQPVRLELPLRVQVPLLDVRSGEVRRDHRRFKRLELVVRIVGGDKHRLDVVESYTEGWKREDGNVARDAVPVSQIVQLRFAEEGRRLPERVGEGASRALEEDSVAAAQDQAIALERRPGESEARHDVVVIGRDDALAVGCPEVQSRGPRD